MKKSKNIAASQLVAWEKDDEIDAVPGSDLRPYSEPFERVVNRVIQRRTFLKGTGAVVATFAIAPGILVPTEVNAGFDYRSGENHRNRRLTFDTISSGDGTESDVRVPNNYEYNVILKWGDRIFPDAPAFDVYNQTAASQAKQFGFNADLVLWYPLPITIKKAAKRRNGKLGYMASQWIGIRYPELKNKSSRSALVVVSHEYTSGVDMFPGYDPANPTQNEVETEIEAHGFTIVELKLMKNGEWVFNIDSPFNRRVTGTTPVAITGPLKGHPLLQTGDNPTGDEVLGCLNNCAGGKTPWGTILTCEENFDQYFANFPQFGETYEFNKRIAAPSGASDRKWENYDMRFDLGQEPNEYHRFGYIVEVDPYNPQDKPKKRTALGRFKHEGAVSKIAEDGRVVIYSGDDARFEYVYKFVSKYRFDPLNRKANLNLLDEGKLYVAEFLDGAEEGDEMGNGIWHLVHDTDDPEPEKLIDTRGTADALGATPMDRPEDIEVSPKTGKIYIALTNNTRRDGKPGDMRTVNGRDVSAAPNAANPRNDTYDNGDPDTLTGNEHGHVIELIEDYGNASATTFKWNIFIKCGDPAMEAHGTRFGGLENPAAAGVSPISDPDNLVHDDDGNLWISTDGMTFSDGAAGFGQNDGVFAVPVEGSERGRLRQFLSGVPGGEICGSEFSGDNRAFFCAIQHPNDGEAFDKIWPLTESDVSKPSLIGVRHISGKKIGMG